MKKTVKLLSGLALAAAFIFVSFSSFSAPEATVVDDCGCPPGWTLHQFRRNSQNPNLVKDLNGDKAMCYKNLKSTGKENGNGNGNNLGSYDDPRNWKDNNQPCD